MRQGKRSAVPEAANDEIDVCEVMETRLGAVEIWAIDGHPIPPAGELKREVLRSAELALRKAAREYRRYEVTSGCRCPPGCYCVVDEKQKKRRDGWKDAGEAEVEAHFTFPGASELHNVKGVGDRQVRFLSGTCRRNEIMEPGRGKG